MDQRAAIESKCKPPYGDRRQEIVFIGQGLDEEQASRALDACLLNENELAAGPERWKQFPDPSHNGYAKWRRKTSDATGDRLGDFAAIHDEDVEIVSVARPQARTCETLAKRLIRSRRVPQLRWIQPADDPEAPTSELPATIDADTDVDRTS